MPKKATVHDKLSYIQMNQWSKFLKKLGAASMREYNKVI